jgi:hypothetical protein
MAPNLWGQVCPCKDNTTVHEVIWQTVWVTLDGPWGHSVRETTKCVAMFL